MCMLSFFSLIRNLILSLSQVGALSLQQIVSCGIKLLKMFKIDLLKIATCPSTLVFHKTFSQSKNAIDCLVNSAFAFL